MRSSIRSRSRSRARRRSLGSPALLVLEPRIAPAIFIVNSFGDAPDAAPGDGDADISEGDDQITATLRSAIEEANALPGVDEIRFDIRQFGSPTISPFRPLPAITEAVIIDGYTQPGAAPGTLDLEIDATPLVQLNGQFAGGSPGLILQAGASTVRGLVITGFTKGIQVFANDVTLTGNFIGAQRDGLTAGANGIGIELNGANARVGGATPAERNLISGNADGIAVVSPATGTVIQGNFIGGDRTGLVAIPNTASGIVLHGSGGNQIGGPSLAAGNVISGNVQNQIRLLTAANNTIQGNRIGSAPAGNARMSRGGADVGIALELGSTGNSIGGTVTGTSNVIGANDIGILFDDSSDNQVQGNYIGVSNTITPALPNGNAGISLRNVSDRNLIGGFAAAAGNTIASNGGTAGDGPGVFVASPARGNQIVGNSMFNNAGLAIDLSPFESVKGSNANDPGDSDTGGNDLQNAPVLTQVIRGPNVVTWVGTLNSLPNSDYRIEFFLNNSGGTAGDGGEGRRFAGFTDVTTDAAGNAEFNLTLPAAASSNVFGTATATNLSSGTSEFSASTAITGPVGPDISVELAADLDSAIPGQPLTYTLTFGNRGNIALRNVSVQFPLPAGTTFVSYDGLASFNTTLPAVGENGTVTIGAATLGSNIVRDFTIVVLVDPAATPGQVLDATATAPVATGETFTENNVATLPTSVLTPPPGTLSIADTVVTETDSDSTALVTVTLSSPVDVPVTVTVSTQDGTAIAPDDYTPLTQTLTFVPGGPLTQTVSITIKGDTVDEPNERFLVRLTNATGADISDGTATVTINNDDATPAVLVLDTEIVEGNSGTRQALVAVTLSSAAKQPITVVVATQDGTARAPEDYIATTQTLTFTPGGPLTQLVPITIVGEETGETDEFFSLVVQSAAGATIGRGTGRVTILDDDVPPDVAPPQVIPRKGIARYGSGSQPTVLVLTFSEPLDPTTVNDLGTYQIYGAGADRKVGTFDDLKYAVVSTVYLPDTNQVVLRMRKRLPFGQRYELRIGEFATTPRDLSGNLLDGDYDGQPGGLLRFRFGNNALAGGIRKAPIVPPLPAGALSLVAQATTPTRRRIKKS